MARKGQFAVEMFFAFTFAILLVFWLINYLELFSGTNDRAGPIQLQQLIARDLGRIANEVCIRGGEPPLGVRGGELTLEAPCLQQKKDSLFYNITVGTGGRTLLIKSEFLNYTASYRASCPLVSEMSNLTRCTDFEKLCIYKKAVTGPPNNYAVYISPGACQ